MLIKASAKVTVYRGHRQSVFFLSVIISLFIMCIGSIEIVVIFFYKLSSYTHHASTHPAGRLHGTTIKKAGKNVPENNALD